MGENDSCTWVAQKYNRHRKSQVLLTWQRFLPNAIAASESCLVWVTTLRKRFSRIKNRRIVLQKSRPCKCGFKFRLTDKPSFSAYTVCTFISGSTFIHAPASKFCTLQNCTFFFVLSNDVELACGDDEWCYSIYTSKHIYFNYIFIMQKLKNLQLEKNLHQNN